MNEFSVWSRFRDHLNTLGLGEVVDELLRPGSPLAFIAAQAMRVAQPTLGAFADDSTLTSFARFADQLEGSEEPRHE